MRHSTSYIHQEKRDFASFTLSPEIREEFGRFSALLPNSGENQKFGRRWELCEEEQETAEAGVDCFTQEDYYNFYDIL